MPVDLMSIAKAFISYFEFIFVIDPFGLDDGKGEKINLNFIFTLLCGASKGFIKALDAFKEVWT